MPQPGRFTEAAKNRHIHAIWNSVRGVSYGKCRHWRASYPWGCQSNFEMSGALQSRNVGSAGAMGEDHVGARDLRESRYGVVYRAATVNDDFEP